MMLSPQKASSCRPVPMIPPMKAPMAQPHAKMAMREEAAKSEKPMSWSHMVKNTMAFQGVDPTIPCSQDGQD